MEPDTSDIGHPGVFERIPDQRRALDRAVKALTGGRAQRRLAAQDGIVSIVKRLDAHHRFRPCVAGVVAGPFAERTLGQVVAGNHFSFDGDLRIGRNRQSRVGPAHQLNRLVQHAAGVREFAHLDRHVGAAGNETKADDGRRT